MPAGPFATIDDLGIVTPSSSFTRLANTTAYASGQLVGDNATAGSVTRMSWAAARVAAGSFSVRRARCNKSTNTTANGLFWLHLYSASPTLTNGDAGAYLTPRAGYLGTIEFDF